MRRGWGRSKLGGYPDGSRVHATYGYLMTGGARRWARHCHESFEQEHARETAAAHAEKDQQRTRTRDRAAEDGTEPASEPDQGGGEWVE